VIVVAVLMLLCVLVARAQASPYDEDGDDAPTWSDDRDRASDRDGGDRADRGTAGSGGVGVRARLYIPITNAQIHRIVSVAPPVADVVAAAFRAAAVAGDPTTGWRRRSRWSALIPMISARAGQNQAWRDVDDPTVSHGVGLDVRASWRFDELLYDPNESRIAMLDVARRRERRRVASVAIHLYFDWVAARAAADADVRAELDAQEKTAELDALTDGWFSHALANRAELR
jgi:hypothetical protein